MSEVLVRNSANALLRVWFFLFKIMAAVFIVETLVMLLMQYPLSSLPDNKKTFLDGAFLLLFLSPILYFLVVRPLVQKNAEHAEFQADLEEAFFELNERKTFIESVLKNIQSGIIVTDPELRINLANEYALDFFARKGSELVGEKLDTVCPMIYDLIRTGTYAAEVSESGRQQRTVGYKRFDLKQADGLPAGHIITFIDISEVEKVRKEMRQKDRLATMGEVVARVAHEMRNPLFGITASSQILAMELPLTAEQKELMNSILVEGRRMNRLVDELLDCSKEMKLKKVPFDMVKAVRDSISFNEPLIMEKRLFLHKSFAEGEVTVTADQERIRQVLVNLLKNAVDAVSEGGSITIEMEGKDGKVLIRILDSGPGIPEKNLEKIFDIFYTTKKSGTGLGLAVSRKIIEAHDGTLVAGNGPGGAVFTITLPRGLSA
ncbi:sensor histidine kinase [Geotalea daltonii]|uniref:sensor histidine kinase n=1 Tax=Geotalea daltonii TaxID=1203471 RepID=UPI00059C0833|nr:ATP-binding protein [Geotalea daltonii]